MLGRQCRPYEMLLEALFSRPPHLMQIMCNSGYTPRRKEASNHERNPRHCHPREKREGICPRDGRPRHHGRDGLFRLDFLKEPIRRLPLPWASLTCLCRCRGSPQCLNDGCSQGIVQDEAGWAGPARCPKRTSSTDELFTRLVIVSKKTRRIISA